jgi:DHA2 family multidrug resistance protein
VGIAVSAAILNDRTNLHFNRIASHLTPANEAMNRFVGDASGRYGAVPGAAEAGHTAALRALWGMAYREASTLAYADAFSVIMVVFLIGAALVPFLRSVAPAKTAPAVH